MKKVTKILAALVLLVSLTGIVFLPMKAFASETDAVDTEVTVETKDGNAGGLSETAAKALAAAIAIGIPAALGALAMGISIAKSVEGISRQPEASGKIQSLWMLGMVFIETVVIYALVVTILIVFVL